MSRTLFWYIFKDLLRIAGLASGVLSGIMSFGGLLKPLYEFGLDISQVAAILSYSAPAMTAYSLPIAALFATTIVYGRLGADNEITACRAAGISSSVFGGLPFPAVALGGLAALISVWLLCFVVPASMLRVERIVYSNLGRLVADQIQRTHQAKFDMNNQPITVFARSARTLETDPKNPTLQAVQIFGATFVVYEKVEKGKPLVPENFYQASEAIVYIQQDSDDDVVRMWAELKDSMRMPRTTIGSAERGANISVGNVDFPPTEIPSPVKENTKFMDIFKLNALLDHPELSQRISGLLRDLLRQDQERAYLEYLAAQLNGPTQSAELNGDSERYILTRGPAAAEVVRDKLVLKATHESPAQLRRLIAGGAPRDRIAEQITIRPHPDVARRNIQLDIEFLPEILNIGPSEAAKNNATRLTVSMPEPIFDLARRPATDYLTGSVTGDELRRLNRDLLKQKNSVISEFHARMSFASSCFILVVVGCALGMMFRSGNFLSAFAVSVVPALICIVLIVTGQHTSENVPWPMPARFTDPLHLGVAIIWSGNAAVLAIAVALLTKLQRQ
jgi:lipopolysaccharide export LptBFGC system permease protein LptF